MFEQSTLPAPARTRRVWTVGVSFLGQIFGVGVAVLLPLVFTDSLPGRQLARPYIGVPPPPGLPKSGNLQHVKLVEAPKAAGRARVLVEPGAIPSRVAMIVDPPPATEALGPYVVGGIGEAGAGGGATGVIGSILSGLQNYSVAPPPPPPPVKRIAEPARPPERIKVGGEVQAAKLVRRVMPVYPRIAVQARISGTVRLQAVIGLDGRISRLEVISGPGMLAGAAIDAVRQWLYAPTLLNGDPVEVLTTIDVHFNLERPQ